MWFLNKSRRIWDVDEDFNALALLRNINLAVEAKKVGIANRNPLVRTTEWSRLSEIIYRYFRFAQQSASNIFLYKYYLLAILPKRKIAIRRVYKTDN